MEENGRVYSKFRGDNLSLPPKAGFWLLLLLTVLPGAVGVLVFGAYTCVDWIALQAAQRHYEQVTAGASDLRTVFIAESNQNIHRLNLFAEGVWALLSALLGAIGLHGISRRETVARG